MSFWLFADRITLLLCFFFRISAGNEVLRIAVLVFGDRSFDESVTSVRSAYLEVFGSNEYNVGNYTIVPEFVDGGRLETELNPNRLEITGDIVCNELLNGSIAVVLYASSVHRETESEYLSLVSTISYALSIYQIPAVGVMVRDAEFSKRKIYPTFIRPNPSHSYESYVFLNLLQALEYRQVVVLSVKGDMNGEEFVEMFERQRVNYKIHVQSYVELELVEYLNASLAAHFEEVTSNIIILYAKEKDAETIFAAASDLTGKGKVWVINEEASKAENVPEGVLASRLSQTPLSVLRNSYSVLRSGLSVFSTFPSAVHPPSDCQSTHISWTDQYGPKFLKSLCATSTKKIEFNERCERVGVDYEIINFHDGSREVGILSGNTLRLQEDSIYWPGGHIGKPLEISLPKHLRAVTIHDPPFVYTTPIISLSECENLGTVEITLSGKEKVPVPGPWYPCPKYGQNSTQHYCCAGYAIDLLSNLSLPEANNSIDTSFTFSLHLNDSYGTAVLHEEHGFVLTGALWELDNDYADMAIGGMTINPEREKHIDFSEPWLYHGIRILEKSIPKDSPMQSFLQPMQSSLWTALFISVLTVGLSIFVLDFKSPFDRFYNVDKEKLAADDPFLDASRDDRVDFGEAMWFVWGVLLNSGVSEKTPRSCSARVLGIVWCGFCMIMVASYTANLAAFLVLDQPEKGLTGVTDPRLRNPSANFSFGTVLNSNVYQYFKRHVELSTMFRKMEAHNVVVVSDAITALLNGTLDAFIWDSTRLDYEAARHCELRTRGSLFGRSAYGVGLQKNSPWTPHITSAILRMSESGMMESLDMKWIDSSGSHCVFEVHKSPARLGLTNMKDVFILVSGGVFFSIFFSIIEVTYGRRKAANGRKRALALRYAEKWRRLVHGGRRPPIMYNLARPVIRRGFAGLEPSSLEEVQRRNPTRIISREDGQQLDPAPFVPDLYFQRHSVALFCSRCRNLVETDVHAENGLFAYSCSIIFILLFLWPCSPLPCYLSAFSDFVHICPICAHKIGRFRRCRRPRFYV